MSECQDKHNHKDHDHQHGVGCGHTAIEYDGDTLYVHDGHLHSVHDNHVHCKKVEFSEQNPDGCNPLETQDNHVHDSGCGHESIPHGDHVDYLVDGRLHHQHEDHVDDHGPIKIVE